MHRRDHFLILLRPGDREHVREALADDLRLIAHAAGDDHAAVLGNRLADRFQALFLGGIEEAAGVDQHDVRARIIGGHLVSVGAQLGDDPLAVDQMPWDSRATPGPRAGVEAELSFPSGRPRL